MEVFRRTDRKLWLLQTYSNHEVVEVQSINLVISITAIYQDIEFANLNLEKYL